MSSFFSRCVRHLWTFYEHGFMCTHSLCSTINFCYHKNATCHEINWHDLLRRMQQRHHGTEHLNATTAAATTKYHSYHSIYKINRIYRILLHYMCWAYKQEAIVCATCKSIIPSSYSMIASNRTIKYAIALNKK